MAENRRGVKGWYIDKDSQYRWIYHKYRRHVLSVKTRFQQVELIDTYLFGRMVILDDKIQSTEKDEFIYHEALVHPAMIAHPGPRNVLIIGGGEGATLREVLRHNTVSRVTMIDIDEEFVGICRKYLKKWHRGSFDDRRVDLVFADASEYLKGSGAQFDVIITDVSDPVAKGPAMPIYMKKFYLMAKKALMPGGIFVTHANAISCIWGKDISSAIFRTIAGVFPRANLYSEYVPSFGSLWSFVIGSLRYRPERLSVSAAENRIRRRNLGDLFYYDAEVHRRLFRLPKCLRTSHGSR